jgi:hypothetical protein
MITTDHMRHLEDDFGDHETEMGKDSGDRQTWNDSRAFRDGDKASPHGVGDVAVKPYEGDKGNNGEEICMMLVVMVLVACGESLKVMRGIRGIMVRKYDG